MYACDFETRNDEENCSVWHWGYSEIGNPENWSWGTDLDSFMTWLSKQNDTIYFHNERFDGNFIVSWLLNNGFTHNEGKKHVKNTFKTLISKMNVWYSIEICWEDKKSRKVVTKIHDSLKKLPFKLEQIAKDLKLPIKKGNIDYNKHRPIGYIPDENEIAYLENDVKILAMAMQIQLDENLTRMTIGSDCLHTYKTMLGKGDIKKGEKKYRKLFPILDKYIDKMVRKSYKGGWCYVKKDKQGNDIKTGIILDVNSEYPWAMRHNLMPYGVPTYYTGEYQENKTYPLYIQHIRCSFELKERHLPTIQIKKSLDFKGSEYLESSKGLTVDLHLTSVDLKLFKEHYELEDLEYVEGFMFKGAYGLYDEYIDYFTELKMKSKNIPSTYMKCKLLLNNLYGKTGSAIDGTKRIPTLDSKGVVRLVVGDDEEIEPNYVATASFTTAYARDLIIRKCQLNYDRFIYCDTDSAHFEGTEIPENMKDIIHPTKLGYFDLEHTFKRARYLFQKTYIYEAVYDDNSSEIIVKGAGMTEEVKENLNFDNFYSGVKVDGLKKSKAVKGGVIIEEKIFTLRERGIRI